MWYSIFELSSVSDFGITKYNFVEGGVVERLPVERVGDFIECLGLEGLAAVSGIVSHFKILSCVYDFDVC